jgi:ABC-type glycerol-3-phosphate transport system substrate-binding protein
MHRICSRACSTVAWLALVLFAVAVGAAPVTIEFMYLAGAEASENRQKALEEAFERENPDIDVSRIRLQSDYRDKVVTLLAAGTLPDIVAIDMNFAVEFADERAFFDLMPMVKNTPSYQLSRVAPAAIRTFESGGRLFALPSEAAPTPYAYNVQLFDESGLEHPGSLYARGAWGWDAFRVAARKVTRELADGQYSVVGASLHLPRVWLWTNGGTELDDSKEPTKATYDMPESVQAL